jgi:hypothetical protein
VPPGSLGFDALAVLEYINYLRSLEGSPPLVWNNDLAAIAAAWAKGARYYSHGGAEGVAQNIGMASAFDSAQNGIIGILGRMYYDEKAAAAAAGVSPRTDGCGGRCSINRIVREAGHFCILMDPCASRIGSGIAPAAWDGNALFGVIDVN